LKKVFCLLIVFIGSLSNASNALDCRKMERKKIEIEVLVSNIENRETTRTSEGGPYKPKKLVCRNEVCVMFTLQKSVLRYLPDHPDANTEGLVKFPQIDLNAELEQIIAAKGEYESLTRNCKALNAANARREATRDKIEEGVAE
jgi:flagellar basal-body rod protein FlgC